MAYWDWPGWDPCIAPGAFATRPSTRCVDAVTCPRKPGKITPPLHPTGRGRASQHRSISAPRFQVWSANWSWATRSGTGAFLAVPVPTVFVARGSFFCSWGAPHDLTAACSPGDASGNYLMCALQPFLASGRPPLLTMVVVRFPQATDGTRENNRLFSQCSIDAIDLILQDRQSGNGPCC